MEAFLVGGVRTPVGRYGGALASVRPDDLAALVVREAVGRARAGGRPAGTGDALRGVGQGASLLVERL